MKLDAIVMGQPVAAVGPLAEAVEAAGFDGLWFTEGGRSAYLGCTAAALRAPDSRSAPPSRLAFPRSPMVTASWPGNWPS